MEHTLSWGIASGRRLSRSAPGHVIPTDVLARFCCQNPACELYGERDAGNLSIRSTFGEHQYLRLLDGNACKARVSENKGTAFFRSKLPTDTALSILNHLVEGNDIRQTTRLVGVHRDTVMRLARLASEHAKHTHDELDAYSPRDS